MKKLLDELQSLKAEYNPQKYTADADIVFGIEKAIIAVREHNPWHEVGGLPERDERIQLAKYNIEYSVLVIVTDEDKLNFEVGFYNHGSKEWRLPDDANFIPAFWAYLPGEDLK